MKRRVDSSNTNTMTTLNQKLCCALLTAGVALSAFGGGGGGDDGGANATNNSDAPAKPTASPTFASSALFGGDAEAEDGVDIEFRLIL
jgi:hypothetical protein